MLNQVKKWPKKWAKKPLQIALVIVFGTGIALSPWFIIPKLNGEVKSQKRIIKELKESNKLLKNDKKFLIVERRKTAADYHDLSERYFQLKHAPVSRGAQRDPVLEYRAQLETFLRQRGSPLASYVDTLLVGENTTGVSAKLIVAIAMVESVGGIRNANAYNAWGRKANSHGYMAFSSWPDAILNQFNYVQNRWNSSDPHRLKGYATNPAWAKKVSSFMNQI